MFSSAQIFVLSMPNSFIQSGVMFGAEQFGLLRAEYYDDTEILPEAVYLMRPKHVLG